jgi:hypothetical protein
LAHLARENVEMTTTTVTDLRNDREALNAFIANWDFNPVEAGKPYGLRFTLRDGQVRCGRAFASKRSAERALSGNVR